MSSPIPYRPEIDGLRAIAVSAVVLYHAEFIEGRMSPVSGGYLGVDIFFVISGYLISSILVHQISAGTFSFQTFYARRIRRLLPALMVVILPSVAGLVPFVSTRIGKLFQVAALNPGLWRELLVLERHRLLAGRQCAGSISTYVVLGRRRAILPYLSFFLSNIFALVNQAHSTDHYLAWDRIPRSRPDLGPYR